MAKNIKDLIKSHDIRDIEIENIEKQSTGIADLNAKLDGGFPVGKQVELYGPPGGGKSAIALQTAGTVQAAGGKVLWLDLEAAFSPETAALAGVSVDDLIYVDAGLCAEDALALIQDAAVTPDIDLVVVDSVAGMTPRAEVNGEMGDSHVGLVARLMSQACRKINQSLGEVQNPATIIWVNQIRATIGGFGHGPQTTTTGGKSLGFWCSTRVEIARTGNIKKGETVVGQKVKAVVRKARYSPPFATANFDVIYESGISNSIGLVEVAINAGVFEKSGAWITNTLTGEKKQGSLAWANHLDDTPEDLAELEEALTTVI